MALMVRGFSIQDPQSPPEGRPRYHSRRAASKGVDQAGYP